RLIGAVGAMKCKGDSTDERPHRRSEILTVSGEKFNPSLDQQLTPFDLYTFAEGFLPKQPEEPQNKRTKNLNTNGGFNISEYTHLLVDYKENSKGMAQAKCPSHNGKGSTSLFINPSTGAYKCLAGCDTTKIRAALGVAKPAAEEKAPLPPIIVRRLADVQAERVSWLWNPYIPLGKLTLVEGDPG